MYEPCTLATTALRQIWEICSYEAGGKKTKVRFLTLPGANTAYGIEGTEQAYGAPGATMMTTTYDEWDLPAKVVFQDANHNSIRSVLFVRDSTGRLSKEEMHAGEESPSPGRPSRSSSAGGSRANGGHTQEGLL